MTKLEKATIQKAIDNMRHSIEYGCMTKETEQCLESRIDALEWVLTNAVKCAECGNCS